MNYFSKLNKILNLNQKRSLAYLSALMVVAMLFEILTLYALLILLKTFSDPTMISTSQIILYIKSFNFELNLFAQILFIFLLIFLIKNFIVIYISWMETSYISMTRAQLSHDYFNGYLHLPRIFHLRTNISETIKNITIEIDHLIAAIHSISIILMEIIILIGLVIFLIFVNYKIAISSFFALLIFSYFMNLLNSKKILKMGRERVKFIQLRLKYIMEGLGGSKVFNLTNMQNKIMEDFNKYNYKIANISRNVAFRNNLPKPLFEFFILLIVVISFYFISKNNFNISEIVPIFGVFLTAAYRLVPSFGRLMSNLQRFQFNIQSVEKLSKDKEKFIEQSNKKNDSKEKLIFKNNVTFKNVNFSYSKNLKIDQNFVLKNLNFELKIKDSIGIIGKSGSGKSTFLDLLMGLMDPQQGEIFIDNKQLKDIKNSWQKNIGCVPQEVFIADSSIKENVAFGLSEENIDIEKVNKAIEIANLSTLVKNLNFGINTILGEKGSRISGGQRQRIGIARAMYNNPDIIILDEATSALDIETEKNIIDEIFSSAKNKTIIIVSHKYENLRYCKKIYEIKNRTLIKN